MLLEVKSITKTFHATEGFPPRKVSLRALDGVSFSVDHGEALGIVGESGCGKSTAARATLRLIEADSGSVQYDGEDVLTASPKRLRALRQSMQMVFQDPASALDPRQRVGDALAEPLHVHKLAKGADLQRRVAAVLDEVGLPATAAERFPHEFSGGQRQRIGIARALVLEPGLVIADEPVSALDVSVQAQILKLLARLKADRGLAYVFVSHDLGVVRYFCERTVVMYLGRVIESGPTSALFDAPKHPYTVLLRGASPVPDPSVEIARSIPEGEPPSPMNPPPGCHFHPRCPLATDICRREVPPLRSSGAGRLLACHNVE
ncbi:ATP-binding cassette domain-containing protein [Acuticoccus sp. MNP-M23]|uniref:ABC transporter ATP-binding protein n=1 Tax=Acuticoccus sp. MNP-M23 TaxID=3072793 RepID=UPI002815F339|nr:oligopeptide/dipeptide ABC transporter ATP-binding protein [Acuticoccus sp. MNP-M23]WMS41942.1 ATP-binding cassette domain-containing protein [Acuticoccus sp. MNP-M23]